MSTLASELPASLQVILISKILSYEASLSKKEQVSIYIIASPEIYRSFYKLKTKGYSEIKIDKLEIGAQLPDPGFDLVYVADEKLIGQAIEYATANHALLISSHSSWVKKGITLGLGATDGRPKFYLNLTTSTASGLQWDDKILSIAQTVR
ncbi:YfiR/HmsC family protein [Pseudoalteromonas tunicata]|uniref:YfiR/HmsC family protein n=1 Tax=Pseudoalteromonas tunicata TaxID=314281 RepID=UPI0012FD15B1|nr:YfiR/HmsC family protein [Pseudoalteromonas tunicata]MDP4985061.1 YfiR family protein [Pseudoalteromonas tunicata]MDP5213968.1 YfiR/HmsC family protein [Pseudoalteromonas tunicata]